MLALVRDPKLFPVIILAMYALAAGRYALARNWPQALYWVAAFALTYLVTFSIPRH